jgi:hypothetical protein
MAHDSRKRWAEEFGFAWFALKRWALKTTGLKYCRV